MKSRLSQYLKRTIISPLWFAIDKAKHFTSFGKRPKSHFIRSVKFNCFERERGILVQVSDFAHTRTSPILIPPLGSNWRCVIIDHFATWQLHQLNVGWGAGERWKHKTLQNNISGHGHVKQSNGRANAVSVLWIRSDTIQFDWGRFGVWTWTRRRGRFPAEGELEPINQFAINSRARVVVTSGYQPGMYVWEGVFFVCVLSPATPRNTPPFIIGGWVQRMMIAFHSCRERP